ncbi:hypothetical protein GR925_22650 [Streptomyces sp. HUCO-GS316]|nr:hypothetical protein [Streptomyces sp. HUCO-GS316]MXM66158.1 hypothetical protein [Streptomyces sp. HUCO-GS316]
MRTGPLAPDDTDALADALRQGQGVENAASAFRLDLAACGPPRVATPG